MPIVEMEAARTEDARREVQLRFPVPDDGATEEAATPDIHLAGNLLGGAHEYLGSRKRQLQVALVVERHVST